MPNNRRIRKPTAFCTWGADVVVPMNWGRDLSALAMDDGPNGETSSFCPLLCMSPSKNHGNEMPLYLLKAVQEEKEDLL